MRRWFWILSGDVFFFFVVVVLQSFAGRRERHIFRHQIEMFEYDEKFVSMNLQKKKCFFKIAPNSLASILHNLVNTLPTILFSICYSNATNNVISYTAVINSYAYPEEFPVRIKTYPVQG